MDYYVLESLLLSPSVSGDENSAINVFNRYMDKISAKKEFQDNIGNSAYSIGNGQHKVMISAHIDEVGMQVQYITDDGFIHFISTGGVDKKILPGSTVNIMTVMGKRIKGIIGKPPVHTEDYENKDKAIEVKDLKIDVGAESKEEVIEMGISIGDAIYYDKHVTINFGKNRVFGGGLDDKVGVFVVTEVMRKLAKIVNENGGARLKNIKVYGVACTQEEVGGYGAHIAAKRIDPEYSIDYDVTFATDDGNVDKSKWGDIILGKGGCIAFGPDKNRDMCNDMVNVCNHLSIPYQSFSVKAGMTNTIKIKLASTNAKTMLLSIPQRNMHTPVEVCDFRDMESLINMTVSYILWLDETLG